MRFMKKTGIFAILFLLLCPYSQAQKNTNIKRDTTKGFDFFFSPGMYVGNKTNANYYRGFPTAESDYADPDIKYIFNPASSNGIWYNQIMELMVRNHRGIIADTFWLEEVSQMRYSAGFSFAIGARYRFAKNFSLGIAVAQSLMTANGIANIGIKIDEVNSANVLPYPLVGKERRTFFELTAQYLLPVGGMVTPLFEVDMHINSTKVNSSDLIVEGTPFTLLNKLGAGVAYDPNLSQSEVERRRGGVGYGFTAAVGCRIAFNKWAALEPVAQFRMEKIQLAGYNAMTPNYNFMIRLVLGDKAFAAKKKSE